MHTISTYVAQRMIDGALNAVFVQSHQLPIQEFTASNGDVFTWEFKIQKGLSTHGSGGILHIADKKGDVKISLQVNVTERPGIQVHTFMSLTITRDSNLTRTEALLQRLRSAHEYAVWALTTHADMDEDDLSVVEVKYI